MRLIDALDKDSDQPFTVQKLNALIEDIRNDANRRKDAAAGVAALRVLTRSWILMNEEASLAFERRDYAKAARRLEVMARVRPDNPQVYYHLARAYSSDGRTRKAMEALKNAVARGYRDIEALENSRDLDLLREKPEYRKILEDLKRREPSEQ